MDSYMDGRDYMVHTDRCVQSKRIDRPRTSMADIGRSHHLLCGAKF